MVAKLNISRLLARSLSPPQFLHGVVKVAVVFQHQVPVELAVIGGGAVEKYISMEDPGQSKGCANRAGGSI